MSVSQTQFRQTLLDPNSAVPEGLQDPQGRIAGKRFDVYRNNVATSLGAALEAAFPIIHKLVGDQFFKAMSGVYLRANPPETPLMMYYGAQMPAFLTTFEPVKSLPYLPDMARLELMMRHSYHAADVAPIDPAALAEIAPDALENIRFTLAPAVQILRSDWPIHAIYLANTVGGPQPEMHAQCVLITRAEFDPVQHLISTDEAIYAQSLATGSSLKQASDACAEGFDPSRIIGLLLGHKSVTKIT